MCLKRLRIKTKLMDLAKWEFLIILNLTIIEKEQKPVFKGPSVDGTGFPVNRLNFCRKRHDCSCMPFMGFFQMRCAD